MLPLAFSFNLDLSFTISVSHLNVVLSSSSFPFFFRFPPWCLWVSLESWWVQRQDHAVFLAIISEVLHGLDRKDKNHLMWPWCPPRGVLEQDEFGLWWPCNFLLTPRAAQCLHPCSSCSSIVSYSDNAIMACVYLANDLKTLNLSSTLQARWIISEFQTLCHQRNFANSLWPLLCKWKFNAAAAISVAIFWNAPIIFFVSTASSSAFMPLLFWHNEIWIRCLLVNVKIYVSSIVP